MDGVRTFGPHLQRLYSTLHLHYKYSMLFNNTVRPENEMSKILTGTVFLMIFGLFVFINSIEYGIAPKGTAKG